MVTMRFLSAGILAMTTVATATSKIEFILETGGDNHAAQYEDGYWPQYTSGVTDGSTLVGQGGCNLNWAVRVLVHGAYNEVDPGDNLHVDLDPVTGEPGPGHGQYPLGIANVVFDLVLKDDQGQVVPIGRHGPWQAGFHSTINDGDADGARGDNGLNPDPLENGAFTSVFDINSNGGNGGRLIDLSADGGPNLDRYTFPSTAGWPPESIAPPGYLIGFGAGYSSFDFGVNYVPGVGMAGPLGPPEHGCGSGLVPFHGAEARPQPLFEGQIYTSYPLQVGIYELEVIAAPEGNNILHGDINCAEQTFGAGSFAAQVNEVILSETTFMVGSGDCFPRPMARHLFYNHSFYDGNNIAINAGWMAGPNNDDDDAIDPTKFPLLQGEGLAQPGNWTGYRKGINGLMFDLAWPDEPVTSADFSFTNIGRLGTEDTPVTPIGFAVRPGEGIGGTDRVVITFPDGLLVDTWLKVEIGTGFGLPAPDICYWGNAVAESGTAQGSSILVDGVDILGARDNIHNILNRALVSDLYDYNKDSLVNGVDVVLARDHPKNILTAVKLITR